MRCLLGVGYRMLVVVCCDVCKRSLVDFVGFGCCLMCVCAVR